MSKPFWSGVFPAITTQLKKNQSLDLDATAAHAARRGISLDAGPLPPTPIAMDADRVMLVLINLLFRLHQVPKYRCLIIRDRLRPLRDQRLLRGRSRLHCGG